MVHPSRIIPAHMALHAHSAEEKAAAAKPKRVRKAAPKAKAKRVRKPKATAAAPRALVDQLKAKGQ